MILIIGIVFSLSRLQSPNMKFETEYTEFSVPNVMDHIEVIAKEPHMKGTNEHIRVSNYIIKALKDIGVTPEVQETLAIKSR